MKYLILIGTICIGMSIFIACSGGQVSDEARKQDSIRTDSIKAEFDTAVQATISAEVTETKLFSDFIIGQTPEQVDSVIKKLYQEGNAIHVDDINSESDKVRDEESINVCNARVLFHHDDKLTYVSLYPRYADGLLSTLRCWFWDNSGNKFNPLGDYLFNNFGDSHRGREFNPITSWGINRTLPYSEIWDRDSKNWVREVIWNGSYFKDNLQIHIFSRDCCTAGIEYMNGPDTGKELTPDPHSPDYNQIDVKDL